MSPTPKLTPPLRALGLRKRYGQTTVVEDVGLSVRPGEVLGLLGPNGAGKTTTFYMLVGLVRPDGGEIRLGEAVITREPIHARAKRGIAYLPQEASVFRGLSVEDNLGAILELRDDLTRQARRPRCDALLGEFSLSDRRRRLGSQLSGGERRRTEIARALAMDPRYVLLDEPFAGVDPIWGRFVASSLPSRLGASECSSQTTTSGKAAVCDRATILAQDAPSPKAPGSILSNQQVRDVYLGSVRPLISPFKGHKALADCAFARALI